MAGTHEGGEKAAETTKERHDEDFHKKIGNKGGHAANHGEGNSRGESSKGNKRSSGDDDDNS